ncbi:MAG: DUF4062 domain-containing protein [Chloroflexi bacterium]|nr:DUF4062 domain-containing protein [Chloroflexota bacterium]
MRVFISSVIRGFEAYRDAAARATRALRHEAKRAEDFAASSATPQQACLAGVRWAEAVILILGARYGEPQSSGLSPTHEEYREARERCQVLVFAEQGVEYERAQQEFLREVQGWTTGHYTAFFSDAEELRDAVTAALRDLELARATGPVDEGEMLGRAQALLRDVRDRSQGVMLTLVVAGGPRQQVLRPRELEAPDLEEEITREALFGASRVFDRTSGTRHSIREGALVIEQEKASIYVDQLGTVRLIVPAERPRARRDWTSVSMSVAIREDVEEVLQRTLRFVAWILDRIDPVRRISDVVPVANLEGALTWRTRAEHERSPNSFAMRTSNEPATVALTPARRHRAALSQDAAAIAEDLGALLERKMRQ